MSYPNMLGIKGIQFVWRGNYSDPLVIIKRKKYNYWDIEDIIWETVEEMYDVKFKSADEFHNFVEDLTKKEQKEIYWNICEILGI